MRLVAFDIESPNGMFLEGNICEFGYVLTDTDYNVILRENILIKPINHTAVYLSKIKLAYTMKEYMKSPTFLEVFPTINAVLSLEDTLVVGHAIHNDILCMVSACKVHGVNLPNFKFIDSQILFSIFKNEKMVCALDKIAIDLEVEFRHHRADEDAKLALMTLLRICQMNQCNVEQLIEMYEVQCGRVESGYVVNCRTPQFTSVAPSTSSRNSKKKLINNFLLTHKPQIIDMQNKHSMFGKRIVMDLEIEYADIDITRRIIQRVSDIGARYLRYGNSFDIFVTSNDLLIEKHPKNHFSVEGLITLLGGLPTIIFDDVELLERIREDRNRVRQEDRFAEKKSTKDKKVYTI